MSALVRAGDAWAQDKSASELDDAAFGALGAGDLVRHWFRVASLMAELEKLAFVELEKRNRPTGGGYFDDGVGKEVMLFGFQLPRLYERLSGKRFTVSTDEAGKKKSVGGVRFVQRAASVIALDAKSAANVVKHVRVAKEWGLWGVTAMSKKDTRVPLE